MDMDIKINPMQQSQPVEQAHQVKPDDGTFKFILASNIEESDLANPTPFLPRGCRRSISVLLLCQR